MRYAILAAAILTTAPAAAEPDPLCFAAADRIMRAMFTIAADDPVIQARATKTPTEADIQEAVAKQADRMPPDACPLILGLPDASVESLARSFLADLRAEIVTASPTP